VFPSSDSFEDILTCNFQYSVKKTKFLQNFIASLVPYIKSPRRADLSPRDPTFAG
jgi:hypothetical protein